MQCSAQWPVKCEYLQTTKCTNGSVEVSTTRQHYIIIIFPIIMQDSRFTQQCWWRFKSFGTRHHFDWYTNPQ